MFTKQKQFTEQNKTYTNTLYLQNKTFTDKLYLQIQNKIKSLHTCYVYKTKQTGFTDKICLQNKTKQMFTKQRLTNIYVYKTKQNKRFTDKLCLQNKTKVYKHVIFTKQTFTKKLCLQKKQDKENKIVNL